MDKERAGYDQPPSYYTTHTENGDKDTPYTLYGEHNIPNEYQLTASHLQGYEQPYVQNNTTASPVQCYEDPYYQNFNTASQLQVYEQPSVHNDTTVLVNQPAGPWGMGRVVLSRPPDYMKISIFACICCFWPTAIFAMHFASEARRLADIGDFDNARIQSKRARNLVISSFILGAVCSAVSIYLYVKLQIHVNNNIDSYNN